MQKKNNKIDAKDFFMMRVFLSVNFCIAKLSRKRIKVYIKVYDFCAIFISRHKIAQKSHCFEVVIWL